MSTTLGNDGLRLRWELVPNDAPGEIAVFSMYTGKRDSSNYPALADEMEDFLESISGTTGGIINGYTIASQLFIDEYDNPLFADDNWGNVYSRNVSAAVADGGGTVPYQCAIVVSRLTNDDELPVKRRRNRSFLGPMADNFLGSDGLFTTQGQSALGTKVQTFHTSLQGIATASGVPVEYKGLCNVSYKGTTVSFIPQITNTTEVRVGRVIDTQRRRRNALDEAYDIFPLTVPT
jgi:hypothetical protein